MRQPADDPLGRPRHARARWVGNGGAARRRQRGLTGYEAATRRLAGDTVSIRPEREVELANLDRQIVLAKAAILKGVDATMFVEEMEISTERRRTLLAGPDAAQTASSKSRLPHADLGRLYREKVGQLTAAFEDDALKAQAFARLTRLIEAVLLTPEDGNLAIDLRGELELCAGGETQKASAVVTGETLRGVGCGDSTDRHPYPLA